ncbi:aldehyde dehydrogenase [Boeremia exigua]|uniref:aldehyde dehydrogenase n=1 Tax=Boeremia exigua TaxID=749465 RepID=UPI001E8E184F|nr:aldehyde dehydrogenase [Boeremia exigua]KAH6639905.1 aldehyde dehydrogenase [Boeremia exigua]
MQACEGAHGVFKRTRHAYLFHAPLAIANIHHQWVTGSSSATLEVFNPATDESVGKINCAREAELDAAVAAARAAFEPWAATPAVKRAALLNKLADLIDAHNEQLAEDEVKAMGQPASIARGSIVPATSATFRYYAGWADKIEGLALPSEDGTFNVTQYEPLGVCAGIGPWNVTLSTLSWKVAPALAAGNTVVYKTSEKSPFSVLLLAQLFKEAGFPAGVFNLISGDGMTGALIASHMDIDKVSFTGSGPTGRKIIEAAAKSNLKKVTLELGGKSPSLIFDDADIENALTANSQGFLFNSSQVCIASSRVFVQSSIADKFIEGLRARFAALDATVGDPNSPTTFLGPLADKGQMERVLGYVESGKSEATLLFGGERKGDKGAFVQPTLFLNPAKDAKIYREEIFGPVLSVLTFETEEEAVKLANDTSFGLSASVYTGSTGRALRIASKIRAGTVGVNAPFIPSHKLVFGGYKQSGQGRECGKEGLYAYLQAKTISISLAV